MTITNRNTSMIVAILSAFTIALTACGDKNSGGEHDGHNDEEGEHDDQKPSKEGGHDDHDKKEGGHDEHGEAGGHIKLRPAAAARTKIVTTKAELRAIASEIRTTGQVGFNENKVAHVSPLVAGRVRRVMGTLGQVVKAGAAVATVNSIELGRAKATFLQAKAKRDLARNTFERERDLAERKISSEQDMLRSRSAYLETRADFNAARQALRLFGISNKAIDRMAYDKASTALFSVRAPISGKIVEKHVTLGELVTPSTKMYTIANLENVWIWIDIYERDLNGVHLDDIAYVTADAYANREFEGRVRYLRDQVDVDTRTVRARIEVSNPEELLRPGMFVRVRLADPHGADKKTTAAKALSVPIGALQRETSGDHIVFVQEKPGEYERREVTQGRRSGDWVEILSGIEVGDAVVTEGGFLLKSEAAKASMGGGHSD